MRLTALGISVALIVFLVAGSGAADALVGSPPTSVSAQTTTVAQSSNYNAIWYDYQGNTCHSAGRFWVFFYDGTVERYVSSSDGVSWTKASTIVSGGETGDWAFYCSGNTVYYTVSQDSSSSTVYYRYGTLTTKGSIRWVGSEGSFTAGAGLIRGLSTAIDGAGHWWATFSSYSGLFNIEVWECPVPGSCSWVQTGSWNTFGSNGAYPQIVPMQTGAVAVIWTTPNSGGPLSVEFFNGATWSGVAEIAGAFRMGSSKCVAMKASIGCAVSNSTSIFFATAKYSSGIASWTGLKSLTTCSPSLSVQLTSPPSPNCFASASSNGKREVVVTFVNSNSTIGYFLTNDAGKTWTAPTYFTTSETGSPIRMSSPTQIGGDAIAAWVGGVAPPYVIRFAVLPLA